MPGTLEKTFGSKVKIVSARTPSMVTAIDRSNTSGPVTSSVRPREEPVHVIRQRLDHGEGRKERFDILPGFGSGRCDRHPFRVRDDREVLVQHLRRDAEANRPRDAGVVQSLRCLMVRRRGVRRVHEHVRVDDGQAFSRHPRRSSSRVNGSRTSRYRVRSSRRIFGAVSGNSTVALISVPSMIGSGSSGSRWPPRMMKRTTFIAIVCPSSGFTPMRWFIPWYKVRRGSRSVKSQTESGSWRTRTPLRPVAAGRCAGALRQPIQAHAASSNGASTQVAAAAPSGRWSAPLLRTSRLDPLPSVGGEHCQRRRRRSHASHGGPCHVEHVGVAGGTRAEQPVLAGQLATPRNHFMSAFGAVGPWIANASSEVRTYDRLLRSVDTRLRGRNAGA